MGSSANTISGRAHQGARAGDPLLLPTRQLRRAGGRDGLGVRTVSTTSSNHARSTSRPAMSSGRVMFSAAVSVGIRLNAWKTKPTLSRRKRR